VLILAYGVEKVNVFTKLETVKYKNTLVNLTETLPVNTYGRKGSVDDKVFEN
jgi:hypothetical protein